MNFKYQKQRSDPQSLRELTGLWKYKVRRFRLIYEVDRKARRIRVFALGHQREVSEELADRLRQARRRK